ncbi:MAG: hypothetical protein ACI4P3_04160 [Candidatus Spyradosoma sp.]
MEFLVSLILEFFQACVLGAVEYLTENPARKRVAFCVLALLLLAAACAFVVLKIL